MQIPILEASDSADPREQSAQIPCPWIIALPYLSLYHQGWRLRAMNFMKFFSQRLFAIYHKYTHMKYYPLKLRWSCSPTDVEQRT